jgi:hypothetical protein
MNAPSGVKERATTADPIVIELFDFESKERTFQILMAPSSPADASNRSASSAKAMGVCRGCQINEVIRPW